MSKWHSGHANTEVKNRIDRDHAYRNINMFVVPLINIQTSIFSVASAPCLEAIFSHADNFITAVGVVEVLLATLTGLCK